MEIKTLILLFIFMALEPIYEAMFDNSKKQASKVVQGVWILIIFCIAFTGLSTWHEPIFYLLCRMLFFNYIYNAVRGLRLSYLGSCWYDRYIAKYAQFAPVWFLLLFINIIVVIKYLS